MVDPTGDQEDGAIGPDRAGLLEELWEDDDLHRALQVLKRHDRHRGAGPGDDRTGPDHDPADDDPLSVERIVLEVGRVGGDEVAHAIGDLAHRMLGQVEPEELLLPSQALPARRLGRLRQRPLQGGGIRRAHVEE